MMVPSPSLPNARLQIVVSEGINWEGDYPRPHRGLRLRPRQFVILYGIRNQMRLPTVAGNVPPRVPWITSLTPEVMVTIGTVVAATGTTTAPLTAAVSGIAVVE